MSGVDLVQSMASEPPRRSHDPAAAERPQASRREAIFSDLECVPSLQCDWERLRSSMPRPSLNSDPVRFTATVRALGDRVRPHIAALWNGDRLTALVVGRVSSSPLSVGSGAVRARFPAGRLLEVVQGGLLHEKSPEAVAWIADHLWYLIRTHDVSAIFINRLADNNAAWAAISSHGHLRRRLGPLAPQPYYWTTIPDTGFEGFMARHSGKTRRSLKREGKRLAAAAQRGLRVSCLVRPEDAESVLRDGGALVARTFHAKVGTPFRDDTLWRTLTESEAARGGMRGYFLSDGLDPIAFVLATRQQDRLYLEAIAHAQEWSKFSPGKRLLLELIERESQSGIRLVDFGHGEAEYKRLFCDHADETYSLVVFGPGLRGTSARLVDVLLRSVDSVTRSVVERANAQRIVRRLWKRTKTPAATGAPIVAAEEDHDALETADAQPTGAEPRANGS